MTMLRYIIAFAAALLTGQANAATYYISDCQSGAHASCASSAPACSNSYTATQAQNPATPWCSFTGNSNRPSVFGGSAPAGNVFRFARGGSMTWGGQLFVSITNPANTRTNPTVFEDYTPSWCTGDCASQRPIWVQAPTNSTGIIAFNDAGTGTGSWDEGYIVRNIDIRGRAYVAGDGPKVFGTAAYGSGFFFAKKVRHVRIDNVSVDGFEIGFSLDNSLGGGVANEDIAIVNSRSSHNEAQGLLGSATRLLVGNTTFVHNGSGDNGGRDHQMYLSSQSNETVGASGMVIRGNTFLNNSWGADGECDAVALVAHGLHPNLVIENNTITEDAVGSGCYGIAINTETGDDEPMGWRNLVIRGNKIIHKASSAGGTARLIDCSSCTNALIENNILVRLSAAGGTTTGILVPSKTARAGIDEPDINATVRNNSIYIDTTSVSNTGIQFGSSLGTGTVLASNVVVFGPASSASATCFKLGGNPLSDFTAIGSNTCYRAAGDASWMDSYATLALAQAAGIDTGSSTADPGLTTPGSGNNYALEASSGSAAVIDAAHATHKSRLGYRGKPANGPRDRGACEYRTGDACSAATASVPSSPTGVK